MSTGPVTKPAVGNAAMWMYDGIWGVLAGLFRVPREPPELPSLDGREPEKFKPSPRYLAMQKFFFWLWLVIFDGVILTVWLVIMGVQPIAGGLLLLPMIALITCPGIVAFVAMYLRYDTMWYVMNERSIRIRRGIWIIHETTITFENIQNVTVSQGPVQRYFGVASVVIQTAGGGGGGGHPAHGGGITHMGLIEGVADAPRLRDLFLAKMRVSRGAGLGDDHHQHAEHGHADVAHGAGMHAGVGGGWTPAHIIALREMLAEARKANGAVG